MFSRSVGRWVRAILFCRYHSLVSVKQLRRRRGQPSMAQPQRNGSELMSLAGILTSGNETMVQHLQTRPFVLPPQMITDVHPFPGGRQIVPPFPSLIGIQLTFACSKVDLIVLGEREQRLALCVHLSPLSCTACGVPRWANIAFCFVTLETKYITLSP